MVDAENQGDGLWLDADHGQDQRDDGQQHAAPTTFRAKVDAEVWLASVWTEISRNTWRPTDRHMAV